MSVCCVQVLFCRGCYQQNQVHILPPATKLQQGNVFTPVCHSVHRGGVSATPPPWVDTPWADTPCPVHAGIHTPTAQCMLRYTPLFPVHAGIHIHLCAVHAGIRSTSGRYASHWNAFLGSYHFFTSFFQKIEFYILEMLNIFYILDTYEMFGTRLA